MRDINELRYKMAIAYLEEIASAGFLTPEQLADSKHMAKVRFFPDGVWE